MSIRGTQYSFADFLDRLVPTEIIFPQKTSNAGGFLMDSALKDAKMPTEGPSIVLSDRRILE